MHLCKIKKYLPRVIAEDPLEPVESRSPPKIAQTAKVEDQLKITDGFNFELEFSEHFSFFTLNSVSHSVIVKTI